MIAQPDHCLLRCRPAAAPAQPGPFGSIACGVGIGARRQLPSPGRILGRGVRAPLPAPLPVRPAPPDRTPLTDPPAARPARGQAAGARTATAQPSSPFTVVRTVENCPRQ